MIDSQYIFNKAERSELKGGLGANRDYLEAIGILIDFGLQDSKATWVAGMER